MIDWDAVLGTLASVRDWLTPSFISTAVLLGLVKLLFQRWMDRETDAFKAGLNQVAIRLTAELQSETHARNLVATRIDAATAEAIRALFRAVSHYYFAAQQAANYSVGLPMSDASDLDHATLAASFISRAGEKGRIAVDALVEHAIYIEPEVYEQVRKVIDEVRKCLVRLESEMAAERDESDYADLAARLKATGLDAQLQLRLGTQQLVQGLVSTLRQRLGILRAPPTPATRNA